MTNSSVFIAGLFSALTNIKTSIQKKFYDFYSKRIIDLEIAPTKTFAFEFAIDHPSASTQKRSISKLRILLDKYLSKVAPVTSLIDKPFIQLETNSSVITLNILEIKCGEVLPKVNNKILEIQSKKYLGGNSDLNLKMLKTSSTATRVFLRAHPDYIPLSRYVNYLNYLVRKYNIPLHIALKDQIHFTDVEDTGLLRINLSIEVKFAAWACINNEYRNRYIQVQSGSEDDALFSLESAWGIHYISDTEEPYKYHLANFFMHLDKCLKVLHTLSRKVDYGYSAFSFRTV